MRNTQYAIPDTQSWLLIAFLLLLFLGPLVAPLFQAISLPVVADSGALAHDLLSRYICPTPAKSYTLLGFPMAVCARCWGATIGLWMAWFVIRPQVAGRRSQPHQNREPPRGCPTKSHSSTGPWFSVFNAWLFQGPWALRLCLALGALLLWTVEINAWPAAPLPALIANGANGGFWVGMFVGSIWLAGYSGVSQQINSVQH
jgi:hypothetical protein